MSVSDRSARRPQFDTISDWAAVSEIPGAQTAFAHHGLVVTAEGEVIAFHAGQLVGFDPEGRVKRLTKPGLTEGHGITLVREDREEFLWIADPGVAMLCSSDDGERALVGPFGKGLQLNIGDPRVAKVDLGGHIVAELPTPPLEGSYASGPFGPYRPTGVAVDEPRFGGTGDVWVADGYGSSLVHRYDRAGNHLSVLTGEEGSGRFDCPHAVFIDRRGGKAPELYVADRGNARIQVYDLLGVHLRTFGESYLNSPSAFALRGDVLIVAELFARLTLLDSHDELSGYIGEDPSAQERAGWPNAHDGDGKVVRPATLPRGQFNSPHSVAVDGDGNVYVGEWLVGGRYTKLTMHNE